MNEFWPGFEDRPQFVDPLGWMNTHTNTTTSEASTIVQAPSRSKPLFLFSLVRDKILTDHKQSRSTTGGIARANNSQARSTQNPIPLAPPYNNTRMLRTSTALVLPGLRWFRQSGSNRMELLVRIQPGTRARRKNQQPWHLHQSHALLHQRNNPPEGYPRRRQSPKNNSTKQKRARAR